jgi:hypothetical protein
MEKKTKEEIKAGLLKLVDDFCGGRERHSEIFAERIINFCADQFKEKELPGDEAIENVFTKYMEPISDWHGLTREGFENAVNELLSLSKESNKEPAGIKEGDIEHFSREYFVKHTEPGYKYAHNNIEKSFYDGCKFILSLLSKEKTSDGWDDLKDSGLDKPARLPIDL